MMTETPQARQFELLNVFESLFRGGVYNHRRSTQGDQVALHLYEDLLGMGRSSLYAGRVEAGTHVVNTANRIKNKTVRRGDGTFGELVPTEVSKSVKPFFVRRGPTATLEIGVECKIISVAQSRQIDRVVNDLRGQLASFKTMNQDAVSIAIVGVNRAPIYRSVEGANKPQSEWKVTLTDGRGSKLHPSQEADRTISTLKDRVFRHFDEFLILEFEASNIDPYNFSWSNEKEVRSLYSSALTRIARSYASRFPD